MHTHEAVASASDACAFPVLVCCDGMCPTFILATPWASSTGHQMHFATAWKHPCTHDPMLQSTSKHTESLAAYCHCMPAYRIRLRFAGMFRYLCNLHYQLGMLYSTVQCCSAYACCCHSSCLDLITTPDCRYLESALCTLHCSLPVLAMVGAYWSTSYRDRATMHKVTEHTIRA